jgi:hypothetical protein
MPLLPLFWLEWMFIDNISRKVAEIRGINGSISDVSISGFLIRGLPKEYNLYKLLPFQ